MHVHEGSIPGDRPNGPGPARLGRPAGPGTLARTGAAPPRYAFRSGVTPHPDRVPGSHAPAIEAIAAEMAAATTAPARLEVALGAIELGADLHDAGWWWEAQEAWEIPWRTWAVDDPRARLLRALVQDAAAWLQLERGRPGGVRRLMARAARNREGAIAAGTRWRHWLGLDHHERQRSVTAYLLRCEERGAHDPGAFPALPLRFPVRRLSCGGG